MGGLKDKDTPQGEIRRSWCDGYKDPDMAELAAAPLQVAFGLVCVCYAWE
jgi:hypothetical protein